jgi:hypothetical protein
VWLEPLPTLCKGAFREGRGPLRQLILLEKLSQIIYLLVSMMDLVAQLQVRALHSSHEVNFVNYKQNWTAGSTTFSSMFDFASTFGYMFGLLSTLYFLFDFASTITKTIQKKKTLDNKQIIWLNNCGFHISLVFLSYLLWFWRLIVWRLF